MFRKSEVAGTPADSRHDGETENVNAQREVRRVKGGYKFRWLIREVVTRRLQTGFQRSSAQSAVKCCDNSALV
jgi:hypothetical protein